MLVGNQLGPTAEAIEARPERGDEIAADPDWLLHGDVPDTPSRVRSYDLAMRENLKAAAVGCVAGLAAVSCGSPPGQPPGTEARGAVSMLIEQMPFVANERGQVEVRMVDFENLSLAVGVDRDAEGERAAEALRDALQAGPVVSVYQPSLTRNLFSDTQAWEAEAGFIFADIDTVASIEAAPDSFTLLEGPVGWSAGTVDHVEGLRTIGVTDDYEQDLDGFTALRPIGRALRVTERNGVLAASIATPLLADWSDDSAELLGDDERFLIAARHLDAAGAVSAVLRMDDHQHDSATIPEPFSVVAIGGSIVDGRRVETVVYVFADDAAASSSAREVARIWNEGARSWQDPPIPFSAPYESIDVEAEGRAVIVTMTVEGVPNAAHLHSSRAAVFQHR